MRSLLILATTVAALALLTTSAHAGPFRSRDKDTAKACGICHIDYAASLLPARSWQLIMDNLPDHFGKDASLPEPTRLTVLAYYTKFAGDGAKGNKRYMRGVRTTDTPPRIVAMPFWRGIHAGIRPASFKRPNVGTPGNCAGCHG